jgi:hypothetical protein
MERWAWRTSVVMVFAMVLTNWSLQGLPWQG